MEAGAREPCSSRDEYKTAMALFHFAFFLSLLSKLKNQAMGKTWAASRH